MKVLGMNRDSLPFNVSEGEYSFAKNILLGEFVGSVANEPGLLFHKALESLIIGEVNIGEYTIIFSVGDVSIIGVLHQGIYTEVTDTNGIIELMGFDLSYPIKGECYINFKGECIVAFWDDKNPPRVINISSLDAPVLQEANDLSDTLMFPNGLVSNISVDVLESGGGLLAGMYWVTYRYKNQDNTVTKWQNISKGLWLSDDNTTVLTAYDGAEPRVPTSKAISVDIENIDERYDFIEFALIYKSNLSTEAYLVKSAPTDVNLGFVITGFENRTNLSITEIINQGLNIQSVHTGTQLNNSLWIANLKVKEEIDYQNYANDIQIRYTTELVDVTILDETHRKNTDKGFAHDEVYAFYIILWFANGFYSKAYHIPGREILVDNNEAEIASTLIGGEGEIGKIRAIFSSELSGLGTNFDAPRKFQVEDTSQNSLDTDIGLMGYWENENEYYPLIGGFPTGGSTTEFAGDNVRVRHHKFPSVATVKDRHYSSESEYGLSKFDKLGIEVSNVIIPPSLLYINQTDDTDGFNVTGYQIVYAKRDFNNSTNYGMDILHNSAYPIPAPEVPGDRGTLDENLSIIWTTGGNWNSNIPVSYPDGADFVMYPPDDYTFIRSHCFDVMLDRPAISSLYISTELKLQSLVTTRALYPTGNIVNDANGFSFGTGDSAGHLTRSNIMDYILHGSYIPATQHKLLVDYYTYVPWNVVIPSQVTNRNIYNIGGEEHLHLQFNDDLRDTLWNRTFPIITVGDGAGGSYDNSSELYSEITYLYTLKSYRREIYNSFFNQPLVYTNSLINTTTASVQDSAIVWGGDTFVCDNSYHTTAPWDGNRFNDVNVIFDFMRFVHRFVCESSHNINMRYETLDLNGKYVPKSSPNYLVNIDFTNNEPNQWGYSKDYSSVNDLFAANINSPYTQFESSFPYRLMRSAKQGTESQIISWKSWATTEYFESVRDKGYIENIEGFGNNLLIHHLQMLYITTERSQLEANPVNIAVGTADLFDIPPQPVVNVKTGYSGTQNQLSCSLLKTGYTFVDASMGKIFSFDGKQLDEISNNGLYYFFKDNLKLKQTEVYTISTTITPEENCGYWRIPKKLSQYDSTKQSTLNFDVSINEDITYYNRGDYYVFYVEPVGTIDVLLSARIEDRINMDNPYLGFGYSIVYDEESNRIIVSKKNGYDLRNSDTRIQFTNLISKQVPIERYVNTATRDVSVDTANYVTNVYPFEYNPSSGYDVITFSEDPGSTGSFNIDGGSLTGTYTALALEPPTGFKITSGLITYPLTFPLGYLDGTEGTTTGTEYWDGSAWQSYYTTWVTYGSAAGAVSGADTQSSTNSTYYQRADSSYSSTEVNQYYVGTHPTGAWVDVLGYYYTIDESALDLGVEVTATHSSTSETQYEIVSNWVTIPNYFFLPEDIETKGTFRFDDNEFVSCLKTGDIVSIIEDGATTYKIIQ